MDLHSYSDSGRIHIFGAWGFFPLMRDDLWYSHQNKPNNRNFKWIRIFGKIRAFFHLYATWFSWYSHQRKCDQNETNNRNFERIRIFGKIRAFSTFMRHDSRDILIKESATKMRRIIEFSPHSCSDSSHIFAIFTPYLKTGPRWMARPPPCKRV